MYGLASGKFGEENRSKIPGAVFGQLVLIGILVYNIVRWIKWH